MSGYRRVLQNNIGTSSGVIGETLDFRWDAGAVKFIRDIES